MSDLFFRKSKTIFDILKESDDIEVLKEAPEDGDDGGGDAGGDAAADNTATDDAGGDNADTGDNADNTDDADDEGMGNDEDFDVDTSIDDDGDGGGDDTGDDEMGSDDSSGDLGGGGSDEEVNAKNTDIFSTLSAEEQAIKISELKKIYNDLYIYISDMLSKVNDINPDEDNLEAIYRITTGLYEMKESIGYYIEKIFPIKSYIENDVAYNRYLIIIRSISNTLNLVAAEMEEKAQKEQKNK